MINMIQDRLKKYSDRTKQEEKCALREVAQEIALCALAGTDFFKHACFIGGSCLRIAHGLNRFSEDLDFWTLEPALDFQWQPFLKAVQDEFQAYAFHMEIEDRVKVEAKRKRAFLKKDSIGKLLILTHARSYHENEKLQIKFEIDTHPPVGASYELKDLDFPQRYTITALDKQSLFASKIAALFDSKNEKGRHWYDFAWYVFQKWQINYTLLGNCLNPPQNELTHAWISDALIELIQSRDWDSLKEDVLPFITPAEQQTLNSWNKYYFLAQVEALQENMQALVPSLAKLLSETKGKEPLNQVQQALSKGAHVNDDSHNGHRPLQIALSKDFDTIAKYLIDEGADLNLRDRSGLTPLQTAVNRRKFALAKLLVQKGAVFQPNAPNLAFDQSSLHEFQRILSDEIKPIE